MVVDAESQGGGTTALDDPRVFSLGRRLRRAKLDELPQLLNVILGEMSLVGPRPELPRYTDRYDAEQRAILSVRPGITDYSSIRFSSLDTIVGSKDADRSFEEFVLPEKNRLRLEYVRTRSFLGDLRILWLTAWCVARKMVH
jgi:lipopolysaccharide/colanic/teichoic acid biosynthesis glycosyltransferase